MSAPTVNYSRVLEDGIHVERDAKGAVQKVSLVGDAAVGAAIALGQHLIAGLCAGQVKMIVVSDQSRPVLVDALTAYVESQAKLGEEARKAREWQQSVTVTTSTDATDGSGQWVAFSPGPFANETKPKTAAPPKKRRSQVAKPRSRLSRGTKNG